MNKGMRAVGGLLLGLVATIAGAEEDESPWSLDGEATTGYDSNLSRAAYERDVIDDGFTSGSLALAWNRELGSLSAVTLRGFVEGDAYANADTLNRTGGGLQAIYRWQPSFGFTVPFFQISVTAQTDDYSVALRDNDRYAAQAFMTRRFTDALRLSMGGEVSAQEADGAVYDLKSGRLFLNGDLALGGPWAVYGTYSLQSGDTVSSARTVFCNGAPAADIFGLVDAADAIEPDLALEGAACGQWLAYRLQGVSHVFVAGVNRGFGHHLSLDVSAQQVLVQADGHNEYRRAFVRAGVLARF